MRNLEVILLYTKDFSVSEVASRSPETRMREDGTQAGRASPSGLLSLSRRSTTKGTLFHQTAGPWVYLSLDPRGTAQRVLEKLCFLPPVAS